MTLAILILLKLLKNEGLEMKKAPKKGLFV
jgi:hypothetical protein